MGARVLRSGTAAAAITWACLGACQANPIAVDDAAAESAGLPSAGASSSRGAVTVDRRPSLLPDSDDKLLTQERADAMASARDPALVPIDMQGVGAQAHPTPSSLPNKQDEVPAGESGGFRKLTLTARDWMHDLFGRPDNQPDTAPDRSLSGAPGAGGDLGLPVETQASGVQAMGQRAERPVEVPPPGAGPHPVAAPVQETAGARLLADSAPEYSIQQILKRCRAVLVHPLTWLAVVLIGLTHIAMSRGRR